MSSAEPAQMPASAEAIHAANVPSVKQRQWRQLVIITLGAIAIFLGLRLLPTGTDLNHMDFRVDAKNAIEFCDPLNPQFIPVVAQRSPVVMTIATDSPPVVGRATPILVTLRTASGKPLAPEDLIVAHTRKLHLLLVDPTLTDYQHVHPEPAREKGTWRFTFTPRMAGAYRVFADFTPAATGRGLYASVDLNVGGSPETLIDVTKTLAAPTKELQSYIFALEPTESPIRAGRPVDLRFTVRHREGGAVPLTPVMGAFAHLVAFDESRTGFAHLHPAETNLDAPPDRQKPLLNFKLTIPKPGLYVIWSQINFGNEDMFVPFWIEVT